MAVNRRSLLACASALAAAGIAAPVAAQNYPSQTVRLIVPYVAGGLPDTVARIIGQRLTNNLGQSFVVENKTGAAGAVAATTLAAAPSDGYAFIVTDGPMLAIPPFVTVKPPFNAQKDFVPVSLIGTAPLYLGVPVKSPINTLDELVALAKAKPGTLNYGSAGLGSIHHLTAEAMKAGLGLDITHVPFRGSGQSVPAMIGGQVDMIFASPPALMGFVANGQAKLIAVNSPKRSPKTPNVPTLAEKIPGFNFAFNVVVLAKPGTPKAAIEKISSEIAKIVKIPEVVEQLEKAGVEPVGSTPAQAATALAGETQRITRAAQHANLKPE